jgi:hypothetical protein
MLSRPFPDDAEPRSTRLAAKGSCPRLTSTLAALAALAFTGCGLATYEKKMTEADQRAQRADEENRLLGSPLVLPGGDAAPPMEVFLRPPKGVAKDATTQQGDIRFHYPATNSVCLDVYLLFGAADDDKEKLEKEIVDRFGGAGGWQPIRIQAGDRPAIDFDAIRFDDARPAGTAGADAYYLGYVHKSPGKAPVGVVFHVAKSNQTAADDAAQKALGTYREAGDAVKARLDYGKWRS